MAIDDYFDSSLLCCGSLKYGSLFIFTSFLVIGTWGTNHFVGIYAKKLILIKERQEKMANRSTDQSRPRGAPLFRFSKREDQVVFSFDGGVVPNVDLNFTGPRAKSFEESAVKLEEEEGDEHHEDNVNKINVVLQTVFQNLSNEKIVSADGATTDAKPAEFQNVLSRKQEFQNLSDEKPQSNIRLNDKQGEFHNLLDENLEFQNLSSDHQNLDLEEAVYDTTDNFAVHFLVPDTVNKTAVTNTGMKKSAALESNEEISDEDLMIAARGSFAAGAVFSIMWVASVYGLISMATEVKELLLAPIVMFVIASITCIGLVFLDMGVFGTSGVFAGLIYFLLLLGAVVKVGIAVIFLYCFFVVFSYYKELRDGPSEPRAPTERTSQRSPRSSPKSTPSRPAPPRPPPPRPAPPTPARE